jgi:hypothetical protein
MSKHRTPTRRHWRHLTGDEIRLLANLAAVLLVLLRWLTG